MATINVKTDFGAAGDGSTDDTDAIQSAIDSAGNGDTVFFPSGTYIVSSGSDRGAALIINGDTLSDNVTLAGEGESSAVKLDNGHTNPDHHHFLLRCRVHSGIVGLTIKDMKWDGNKSGQPGSRGGFTLAFEDPDSTSVDSDITISNCWVVDAAQTNINSRTHDVTIEWCTVTGAVKHNVTQDASGPRGRIRYCYLADAENRYGLDSSGGKLTVEDTVIENNNYGTKTSYDSVDTVYRRCRFSNNSLMGYLETGADSTSITATFEDVISEDNGRSGFVFGGGIQYTIGTVLALRNNQSGSSGDGNIEIKEECTLDATEIRSGDAVSGPGLDSTTNSSATVDTYVYSGNAGGSYGSTKNLTVSTETETDCPDITSVPTASEVGAGVEDTTDGTTESLFEIWAGPDVTGLEYTFVVDGAVSFGPNSEKGGNDTITDNGDGTYTVSGLTGSGYSDDWNVSGTITSWEITSSHSEEDYTLYIDDQEVTRVDFPLNVNPPSGSRVRSLTAVISTTSENMNTI